MVSRLIFILIFCIQVNFMIVESLERYDYFYGDNFKVECPTRSGKMMTLKEVALEICRRMLKLFLPDENGHRPCHGDNKMYSDDENWKDLILFYEFFHGETGRGCGARYVKKTSFAQANSETCLIFVLIFWTIFWKNSKRMLETVHQDWYSLKITHLFRRFLSSDGRLLKY